MAAISTPTLTITGSPTPGHSIVKVDYEVTFDAFDKAADQPYFESVKLIGDDTAVAGDPAGAAPDDQLQTIMSSFVRASMIVAPATTLKRSHTKTVSNVTLNEDRVDAPNPDEIRAVVTLTPRMPAPAARESNQVTLALV